MKIALCFSGQLRTAPYVYQNILNYIGDLFKDCDIFVHTWNVNTDRHKGTVNEVLDEKIFNEFKEIYSPKKMIIEDYLTYEGSLEPILYTFLKCDILRKEYEIENNFKYDFVIKIRPDVIYNPNSKLIDEINEILKSDYKSTIYTFDVFSVIQKNKFEDFLWLSTSEIFDKLQDYCNERTVNPILIGWQEDMPIFFNKNNIKYKSLPINNEGIIYPFKSVDNGYSVKFIEEQWTLVEYSEIIKKYFLSYNVKTYAYIETTTYCNLDCSFCNRSKVVEHLKHMSYEDFRRVLWRLSVNPIKEIKLMGMGEPFFHPEFDKICSETRFYFPNSTIISATNCQYKINKIFRDSLQYIDILYLSIDGYKETYELNRKGSSWNRLIEFLEELKSVNRHKCKIVINYVVNPNNVQDIQKVYDEILVKYNLEELRLNIAQNWSEDEHIVSGYSDEQIQYLRDNWKDNVKGNPDWNYSDCFWPKEGVYVTVDRELRMCCLNTEVETFGNYVHEYIDHITSKPRYQEILKGCENNKPADHCKNCSYKELTPILKRIKND